MTTWASSAGSRQGRRAWGAWGGTERTSGGKTALFKYFFWVSQQALRGGLGLRLLFAAVTAARNLGNQLPFLYVPSMSPGENAQVVLLTNRHTLGVGRGRSCCREAEAPSHACCSNSPVLLAARQV